MRSRTLCVLAVVALVVSLVSGAAVASTITASSAAANSTSVTLATSLDDWLVGQAGSVNEKAGGTAISTSAIDFYYPDDGVYPKYTYTNGTSPVSATNVAGYYLANTAADMTITVALNAGVGQVNVWAAAGKTITGTLSSTLESDSVAIPSGAWTKVTFDYDSSVAQNMVINLPAGSGFNGVSFSQVPEPGTIVLLVSGVLGLLAYAWRKRR